MDGRFLYNRRISLNLSQIEVAQSLGYSSQMVSLWESNKNTPSLNVLGKYASILNIDLEGLILAINKKENTFCDELFFDSVAFGQNIRRLRRLKGITQKDLAKIISCPANALMRFEKGISYPSIEQFVALCNYFKVKFDELYFCIKLSPSKDTKAKKKKVILPILIPIIIAVSVGGTTMGVTLSNNRKKASNADINNNSEPLTDLTFYNSGINDDSVTSMDIDLTNKSPLGQALFGTYPQDCVFDDDLIAKLNKITSSDEYGYVSYDGNFYEKITSIKNNNIGYVFNNDLTIEENKEYWFKVMPLAWNIREYDGEGYALLDSQFVIDGNIIFDEDVSWYPESSIREWLNNDFLKKAFHGYESELVLCNYNITSVDGDETNMSDYVFLHSSSDEEYLMSLDPILTSEYTRCKGVSMDFSLGSSFWLSTQAENGQVYYYHSNHLYQGSVNILRHGGIKPQIKVNLN